MGNKPAADGGTQADQQIADYNTGFKFLQNKNAPYTKLPSMGTPDGAKFYSNLVSTKLGQIDWWRDDPVTAAWLTGAPLSYATTMHFASTLPDVQTWVDQSTSFGGVPGALKDAYSKALQIKDLTYRATAVKALDELRDAPPGEQAAFLNAVRNGAFDQTPETTQMLTDVLGVPVTPGENGAYNVGEGADTTQLAVIHNLFPSLAPKLQFAHDQGISFDDIKQSFAVSAEAAPIVGSFVKGYQALNAGKPGDALYQFGVGGFQVGLALAGGGVGGVIMGGMTAISGLSTLATEGQGWTAGSSQATPMGWLHDLSVAAKWGSAPLQAANWAFGHASHSIGQDIFKPILPGHSDETYDLLGNLTMIVATAGVSRGATTALGRAGEFVGVEGETGPEIQSATPEAMREAAPDVSGIHPVAKYIYPIIDDFARNVADGTGLTQWLRGRRFDALYDDALSLRAQGIPFDDAVQRLLTRHPGLVQGTAEAAMRGSDRETMAANVAEFITNPHPDYGQAIDDATEAVNTAQEAYSRVTADADPQREVDALNLEKEEIERQLTDGRRSSSVTALEARLSEINARLSDIDRGPTVPTQWLSDHAHMDVLGLAARFKALGGEAEAEQAAPTDMAALEESIAREGIKKPIEARMNEDGTVSIMDGWHRLQIAKRLGLEDIPVKWEDDNADNLGEALQQAQINLEALKAQALEALKPVAPQLKLPTSDKLTAFLHRAMLAPETASERVVGRLINWNIKNNVSWGEATEQKAQGYLAKIVDKMEPNPKLILPTTATDDASLANILDRNRTALNRTMQRMGFSAEDMDAFRVRLASAKTAQDFIDIVYNEFYGRDGLMAKYTPDSVPRDVRDRLTRPDVDPYSKDMFDDNEFKQGIPLPSADDIYTATHMMARLAKNNKAFGIAYNVAKLGFDVARIGLKPLVLVAALPSIIMTKLADEALGNAVNARTASLMRVRGQTAEMEATIPGLQESMKDTIVRTNANLEGQTVWAPASLEDALSGKPQAQGFWRTIVDRLNKLREGIITQDLVRRNMGVTSAWDVTATADAMLANDGSALSQHFEGNLRAGIEREIEAEGNTVSDARVRAKLENKLTDRVSVIEDMTMGFHPDFTNYIVEGRFNTGRGYTGGLPASVDGDWDLLQTKHDSILAQIADLNPADKADAGLIRGLSKDLVNVVSRMREMQANVEGLEDGPRYIEGGAKQADLIAKEIEQRAQANEIQPPKSMMIPRQTVDAYAGQGAWTNFKSGLLKMSQGMYGALKWIGEAEAFGARGSFYAQEVRTLTGEYIGRGYSPEDAVGFARVEAANKTMDLFYDLAARSSAERQFRNLFWFAPVTGEIAYRWFYGLPAEQGNWLTGGMAIMSKLALYQQAFKNAGIIKEQFNPKTGKTENMITVPGLAGLVKHLTGLDLNVGVPVSGAAGGVFFRHMRIIPELSPLAASALGTVASRLPVVEGLSTTLAPYTSVSLVPSAVKSFLGVFGVKMTDMGSADADQNKWDKTHDQALQYAWTKMYQSGDRQPLPEDFGITAPGQGDEAAYHAAYNAWFSRLNGLANKYSSGLYMISLLDSLVIPGSVVYTSDEQAAFDKFMTDNVFPKMAPGQSMDMATQQLMDGWLSQHKDSLAFSVFTGKYTGKPVPPGLLENADDTTYRKMYLLGIKDTMSPDEYAKVLAAETAQATFKARQNGLVTQAIGTGSAPQQLHNLLTNYGQYSQASRDYWRSWNNYLGLHKQDNFENILGTNSNNAAKAYGETPESLQAIFVSQAQDALNQLSDNWEEGGIPDADFQKVMAQLNSLGAKYVTGSSAKPTPVMEGLDAYRKEVLAPYFSATKPLYDQAAQIKAAGGDASAIYDQIHKVNEQYSSWSWRGMQMPSPEEWLYDSKDQTRQNNARLTWASQPMSWLDDFQRKTVGYPTFDGDTEFWTKIQALDSEVSAAKASGQYTTSQQTWLGDWRDKQAAIIAQQYGPQATAALQMDQSVPAFRIDQTHPSFQQNQSWQTLMQMEQIAQQRLASEAGQTGVTDDKNALKTWMYSYIQQQQIADKDFATIMRDLMLSTTIQGRHPQGAELYNAIFFNEWVPQFEDSNVLNQYVPTTQGVS